MIAGLLSGWFFVFSIIEIEKGAKTGEASREEIGVLILMFVIGAGYLGLLPKSSIQG